MLNKEHPKLLVLIMSCSLFLLTACQPGRYISKFIPEEPTPIEMSDKDFQDGDKCLNIFTGKELATKDKENGDGGKGNRSNKLMKDSKAKDNILAQQKDDKGEKKIPPKGSLGEVKIPIDEMSERELVDYLVSQVPEVYGFIYELGMTANVDGGLTELDFLNYYCRDVWIGTDTNDKFTNEFLYTVSPIGQIYEFDIITNDWYCVSNGDRLILANVRFSEAVSEEWIELLVDDLLWIDDPDEPNGYRIENEVEQWELLYVALWSDFYVLVDEGRNGISSYSVSMDNFVKEINNELRQGEMLAHIYVDKGTIFYIAEMYVP